MLDGSNAEFFLPLISIVILPTPAKIRVGIAVYCRELLLAKCGHTSEVSVLEIVLLSELRFESFKKKFAIYNTKSKRNVQRYV